MPGCSSKWAHHQLRLLEDVFLVRDCVEQGCLLLTRAQLPTQMEICTTFLIRHTATAMILAGTAATGVPLAILAYTPGRPLALQSLPSSGRVVVVVGSPLLSCPLSYPSPLLSPLSPSRCRPCRHLVVVDVSPSHWPWASHCHHCRVDTGKGVVVGSPSLLSSSPSCPSSLPPSSSSPSSFWWWWWRVVEG